MIALPTRKPKATPEERPRPQLGPLAARLYDESAGAIADHHALTRELADTLAANDPDETMAEIVALQALDASSPQDISGITAQIESAADRQQRLDALKAEHARRLRFTRTLKAQSEGLLDISRLKVRQAVSRAVQEDFARQADTISDHLHAVLDIVEPYTAANLELQGAMPTAPEGFDGLWTLRNDARSMLWKTENRAGRVPRGADQNRYVDEIRAKRKRGAK